MSTRLDPALGEEAVSLYLELRSLRVVAERLGISHEGVRLRLRSAGVKLTRHRLTTEERAQVIALYRATQSVAETADRLGVTVMTVRSIAKKAGFSISDMSPAQREEALRRREERENQDREIARCYWRLGTGRAVAAALGINAMEVSKALQRLGLAPGTGDYSPAFRRRKFADRVITVYCDGASVREAAFRVGVSRSTAVRWLREAGFDP